MRGFSVASRRSCGRLVAKTTRERAAAVPVGGRDEPGAPPRVAACLLGVVVDAVVDGEGDVEAAGGAGGARVVEPGDGRLRQRGHELAGGGAPSARR